MVVGSIFLEVAFSRTIQMSRQQIPCVIKDTVKTLSDLFLLDCFVLCPWPQAATTVARSKQASRHSPSKHTRGTSTSFASLC